MNELKEGLTDAECMEVALEQLKEAEESGKWLVSVWKIVDGELHVRRVCCNFPRGDFHTGLALLKRDLDREMGVELPTRLRVAPHIVDQIKNEKNNHENGS